MKLAFEMNYLGELSYFYGMGFLYTSMIMILHQVKYSNEILTKFNMLECDLVITPAHTNMRSEESNAGEGDKVDVTMFRQLVRSLRYLCQSI